MIATLLVRGMIAGVLAGILAFGFARTFGEPPVDRAIAFEEAGGAAAAGIAAHGATTAEATEHDHDQAGANGQSHGDDEELVSRPTQAGAGLFTAVVVYGAALGGIFALVFAFAWGRSGIADARVLAALLAIAGFAVLILVPGIKYPANPPAVGNGETIGQRTALYLAMLVVSVGAAAAGVLVRAWLARTLGAWNATLAGLAAFVAVVVLAMMTLPTVNEVPETFPASLLWQFRVASLGTQAVLWATLGLAFGALAQRSLAPGR